MQRSICPGARRQLAGFRVSHRIDVGDGEQRVSLRRVDRPGGADKLRAQEGGEKGFIFSPEPSALLCGDQCQEVSDRSHREAS